MATIPATTGLDLTEDKLRVDPGTLQACLNYEVAYHSGYRRIDGLLRFDGRPEIEDLDVYRDLVQHIPNGPAYGLHFFADRARNESTLYGVVEAERVEVEDRAISAELLNTPGQRAEIYLGGQQTGVPNAWILEPNASFAGEARDLMEVLTTGQASIGFISAYTRVEVEGGQNIPEPDDQITDGDWLATVRSVEVISGTEIAGNVRQIIWVETDSQGFVPAGDEIVLDGTSDRVGFMLSQSGYSSNGNIAGSIIAVATDLDPSVDKGVVVRTTDQGWAPLQPSYEATFDQGTNKPANVYLGGLQVSAAESPSALPAKPPGTVTTVTTAGPSWNLSGTALTDALQADDGSFTEAEFTVDDVETHRLRAVAFDAAIDPLDEITGFAVEVVAEKDGGDSEVRFEQVLSNVGGSRGQGVEVDGKETFVFGGPNDLWGAASGEAFRQQTDDLIVWVSFRCDDDSDLPTTIKVYSIRIIIYLREGSLASRVFLRSGGVDQEARVLFYSKSGGEWDNNNAQGRITFARLSNPALVSASAQIRTEPGGGGDLVARLTSSLSPVRLPSRERMDQKQAQFEFLTTNFFAAGRLTAVYGASGAGPAFTLNNQYFFKILTGRTEDEPRHVSRHADLLALGYDNGDADFSVAGRPDLFDGALGAFSVGFGQKITGMLPLAGEALGVWTEDSTHVIVGRVQGDIRQQVISPSSGAIEYTVVDMGIPVFCDFRGINTLQASQNFGDFDLGRLSRAIRAWLLPRLQDARNAGEKRPIRAAAVRKKNQYRLFFADGEILTMTWLEDQVPRFTFQRWWLDAEESAVVLRATTTGVDENNQSVSFCSFEGTNFVYRVDHGNSFDGLPVKYSLTFNPAHVNGPAMNQRINIGHIHAVTESEVTLGTQLGTDYREPAGYVANCRIGQNGPPRPSFTKFRHKARGRDFALRIFGEGGDDDKPHTIQVVEFPDLSLRKMER